MKYYFAPYPKCPNKDCEVFAECEPYEKELGKLINEKKSTLAEMTKLTAKMTEITSRCKYCQKRQKPKGQKQLSRDDFDFFF